MPRRASLLVAFLASLIAVVSCGDDPEPDSPGLVDPTLDIVVPDCTAAVVQGASDTATLRVIIKNVEGTTRADAPVVFAAPSSGPSGTFESPDAAGPTYARVRSGADGSATVKLVGNGQPGVYLVEVGVAGADAVATFAITQGLGAAPAPASGARCALEAIPEAKAPGAIAHGPFLVPAGSRVAAAGPTRKPPPPVEITKTSWVSWIDRARGSKFEHPTRFVVADAADPAAAPQIADHVYWPELSLPGAPPVDLVPPLRRSEPKLPELLPASARVAAARAPAMSIRPQNTSQGTNNECAIIFVGTPDEYLIEDAADMTKAFRDGAKVNRVYVKTNNAGRPVPTTQEDLQGFLDRAKADGCSKVHLYMTSHGGAGALDKILKSDGTKGTLEYQQIAEMIRSTIGGTPVSIIIDACYSGTALEAFQGVGLNGELIVAADENSQSGASSGVFGIGMGSYFTEAVITALGRPAADTNNNGCIEPSEAFAYLMANARTRVTEVKPFRTVLTPEGKVVVLPLVDIECPSASASVSIPPPGGAPALTVIGPIGLPPPLVAMAMNSGVAFTANGASQTVRFVGLVKGESTYTLSVYYNRTRYSGSGVVKVRGDCPAGFTPPTGTGATAFTPEPIIATFDAPAQRTIYGLKVGNPFSNAIVIAWSGPNCADYTPMTPSAESKAESVTSSMTWNHPHPPCDPTTSHTSVTVRAVAATRGTAFLCTYQGAESGTGPACSLL